MPIEVRGLKEALATLNKIEPGLRKQITKDIRKIAEPALAEIRALIPSDAPLSGMEHGGRTGWTGKEQNLPKVLLSGKKPKLKTVAGTTFVANVGTIIISAPGPKNGGSKGAAFAIADMAGAGKGGPRNANRARPNLPGALNSKVGHEASRFMWPGANRGLPAITDALRDACDEIIKEANRALKEKA